MSGENPIVGLFTEADPETVAFFEEARRLQSAAALATIQADDIENMNIPSQANDAVKPYGSE